jgi:hypothetical protein
LKFDKAEQYCKGYWDSKRSPFLSSKFHSLTSEKPKKKYMRARKRGEFESKLARN